MDIIELIGSDVREDHNSVTNLKYRQRIKISYIARTTVGSSIILFLSAL